MAAGNLPITPISYHPPADDTTLLQTRIGELPPPIGVRFAEVASSGECPSDVRSWRVGECVVGLVDMRSELEDVRTSVPLL